MKAALTDEAIAMIGRIVDDNRRNIKFYKDDQLITKQNQFKFAQTLDTIIYDYKDPTNILKISTFLITIAIQATDRTPNSQIRRQMKSIFNLCVRFNQIDEDLIKNESGIRAAKNLLYFINKIYIEVFDISALNDRYLKDDFFAGIKKGTMETAYLMNSLENLTEDRDDVKKLESVIKKIKKDNKEQE